MKLLLSFLSLLILAALPLTAAPAPTTNAAPAAPTPPKNGASVAKDAKAKPGATPAVATAPAPAAPAAPTFEFPKYIDVLKTELKLTADEQQQVEALYLADGPTLHDILNNNTLSPLAQAQKVSDLRDTRNSKIETLLQDDTRRRDFLAIEAQYRVALTELAADAGFPPTAPAK